MNGRTRGGFPTRPARERGGGRTLPLGHRSGAYSVLEEHEQVAFDDDAVDDRHALVRELDVEDVGGELPDARIGQLRGHGRRDLVRDPRLVVREEVARVDSED